MATQLTHYGKLGFSSAEKSSKALLHCTPTMFLAGTSLKKRAMRTVPMLQEQSSEHDQNSTEASAQILPSERITGSQKRNYSLKHVLGNGSGNDHAGMNSVLLTFNT
eukprot:1384270-Amphidinium_carterae.1